MPSATPPAPTGPYYFYYNSLFTKLMKGGRANLFKTHRDQPDEELNVPAVVDQLVIRWFGQQRG